MRPERLLREQVLDLWHQGFNRREIAAKLDLADDYHTLSGISDVVCDGRRNNDPRADRTRWVAGRHRLSTEANAEPLPLLCPEFGIESVVRRAGEGFVSVPRLRCLEARPA